MVPMIPIVVEICRNDVWFYERERAIHTCTCVIGVNQSGGTTMTADFLRCLGLKVWSRGQRQFDPKTRRWG